MPLEILWLWKKLRSCLLQAHRSGFFFSFFSAIGKSGLKTSPVGSRIFKVKQHDLGNFCIHNEESLFLPFFISGILLQKLFWPTVRKNCSKGSRKFFEIWGWKPRICKKFEITRTIYSNSKRSEQFLLVEYFFNLFLSGSFSDPMN